MRIALAQINSTVGDLAGNAERIREFYQDAVGNGADLVVFPELALTGYPPEDLLLKPAFIRDNLAALKALAKKLTGPAASLVGFVDAEAGARFNAAAWIEKGAVKGRYHKNLLPNYGVFDEKRYFEAGASAFVRSFKGARVGVTICEDIWSDGPHWKALKKLSPTVVMNLSASPFHAGKLNERKKIFRALVDKLNTPLFYCNAVGGQDELVFDGASFAIGANGRVAAQAPVFEEGLFVAEWDGRKNVAPMWDPAPAPDGLDQIRRALVTGIRDYVRKNRFVKVAIGISGGIDSALVAALAVEALGAENVVGVTMPSRYNSPATVADAGKLAAGLGIKFLTMPVQPIYAAFTEALSTAFANTAPNEAEENLQARIRGSLLMALSNKFGWLVLTTGNKSEMSTGYCTLYGDMAGGFAVLKDILKTTVYALSRRINDAAGREVIPESTIDRAPSAELRANQKDEDSLGAYSALDPVIVAYVEENRSLQDLARADAGREDYFKRILTLIDRNEYKRRQAPPGIKITPRSFGRDHRMPITNRYRAG